MATIPAPPLSLKRIRNSERKRTFSNDMQGLSPLSSTHYYYVTLKRGAVATTYCAILLAQATLLLCRFTKPGDFVA